MSKHKTTQLWTRRQAIWLMTGFTGSLVLHACASNQNATNQTTPNATTQTTPNATTQPNESNAANSSFTIGYVPWVGLLPLYVAQEKGFFTKRGLEVKANVFSGLGEMRAAFGAGKLNAQTTATVLDAYALAQQGVNYSTVMVGDYSQGADGILARNSIASLADFKGKRIAVEQGSLSHLFLSEVLKEAGLTQKDVTLINSTADAAAAAYQAGQIDIAVTYAPYLQTANQARKDGRIIYDSSKMPTLIPSLFLFNNQFVQQKPVAIQAFVDGFFEGKKFLETNRDEALAIAAKQLQVSPQEAAEQLKTVSLVSLEQNRDILGNPNSPAYLAKNLEIVKTFLASQGQTKADFQDFAKLLNPTFVQKAT